MLLLILRYCNFYLPFLSSKIHNFCQKNIPNYKPEQRLSDGACIFQDVESSTEAMNSLQGVLLESSDRGGLHLEYPTFIKHKFLISLII